MPNCISEKPATSKANRMMHEIMKKTCITILMHFMFQLIHAQSPGFIDAKAWGGRGDDRANTIATDAQGNVVIAGRFRSAVIPYGKRNLINADSPSADIFIIKQNAKGKVRWALRAGGKGDDDATCCKTDAKGNIIVVGWFESPQLIFGKMVVTNTNPGKGCEFFIVKISPEGECLWARSAGCKGTAGDYSTCAIDRDDHIIVSGIFDGPVLDFGSCKLRNSGGSDMFLVKYSSDGNVLWARNAAGSGHDEGQSCATDPNGNIYAGGFFTGESITFDSITLHNHAEKTGDVFVAKYAPDGNVIWAKAIGGNSTEIGNCFTDPMGNVYVAGFFASDSLSIGQTTLSNAGEADIFLVKLDSQGTVLWAKRAGGRDFEGPRSYTTDGEGRVFITGSFRSDALPFGKDTLKNTDANAEHIFITAYSPEGDAVWATSAGGKGRNCGRGIATDAKGSIYITGSFEANGMKTGNAELKNEGSADVFVLKYRMKKGK